MPGWGLLAAEPPCSSPEVRFSRPRRFASGAPSFQRLPKRPGFAPLAGYLGTVDLQEDPVDVPVALAEVRVFTGYAGWGPGQLSEEIRSGSWHVLESHLKTCFPVIPKGSGRGCSVARADGSLRSRFTLRTFRRTEPAVGFSAARCRHPGARAERVRPGPLARGEALSMASAFVDESQIHVKGGNGGAGTVSFRREAHVSRGGPDGGDGGRGGNVYLEATTNLASLLSFVDHPHRRGGDGGHGGGKKRHGRNGTDLVVPVPVGTLVRHQNGDVLADLTTSGDRYLAAAGGRGGRGNARFSSNRLRAPAFAEQAELGEEHWLSLELELMADVALVGFPNAGKSTLVSTISAAKPKIADYPFTTLEPHLGVVRVGGKTAQDPGGVEFVVADIPGLIEGASEGRGLGHKFLRHLQRARVLLVLADLGEDEGRAPSDQVRILLEELRRYRPELLDRPRIVAGSRADRRAVAPPRSTGTTPARRRARRRGRPRHLRGDRRRAAAAPRPARDPGGRGPCGGAAAPAGGRRAPPRARRSDGEP